MARKSVDRFGKAVCLSYQRKLSFKLHLLINGISERFQLLQPLSICYFFGDNDFVLGFGGDFQFLDVCMPRLLEVFLVPAILCLHLYYSSLENSLLLFQFLQFSLKPRKFSLNFPFHTLINVPIRHKFMSCVLSQTCTTFVVSIPQSAQSGKLH